MGIISSSSVFSADVLRLEISGPGTRLHLTIVDLPGVIHSENKIQPAAYIRVDQNMVYGYVVNRRCVILAVVPAKNDYSNQIILKLAKEVDALTKRTLGIITEPDTVSGEVAFANLATNMDVEFRLGWHLLRNRGYEMRGHSVEARDTAEEQFFGEGIWKELTLDVVGIKTLRERLSKVPFDSIKAELPTLIEDIEKTSMIVGRRWRGLEVCGAQQTNNDCSCYRLARVFSQYQRQLWTVPMVTPSSETFAPQIAVINQEEAFVDMWKDLGSQAKANLE